MLAPALFLLLVEGGLRLSGYGFNTALFVKTADGQAYELNDDFARQFYPGQGRGKSHPFLLPARKEPGTLRIFVLGESAALGTPNPSFSFSRILEFMLQTQYPERRIEVFNAAMRGINSHIILPIARACAKQSPDLFLVYMGNNETVGLHAPGPEATLVDRNLFLIRLTQRIKSTRLGQWLVSFKRRPPPQQDMDFFRAHRVALDDPGRQAVQANFAGNLKDMCEAMTRSGAHVLLSTVPSNLDDFPPLASLPRSGLSEADQAMWQEAYEKGAAAEASGRYEEALLHFQSALEKDDHFADLHFRMGRSYLAMNRLEEAERHFVLARDRDALPFRADSRLNQITQEAAAAYKTRGVSLVDAERAFSIKTKSEGGLPGDELFTDHVHLSVEGDYLLARTFYATLQPWLHEKLGQPASAPLPAPEDCAKRLAYTDWDDLEIRLSMARLMAHPPFLDQLDHDQRQAQAEEELKERASQFKKEALEQTIQSYRVALERYPEDWQLHHNFAMLWYRAGEFATAAKHLEPGVRLFPNWLAARILLGGMLAKAGNHAEALIHFQEALRLDPRNEQAAQAVQALGSPRSAPR